MSQLNSEQPVLNRLYQKYLTTEDSAGFIKAVSQRYTIPTLERLAAASSRTGRRAAMLALGFVSDMRSNAVFGEGLHDDDRGVRILAENGIRQVWLRDGASIHRQRLAELVRLNASHQFDHTLLRGTEFIEQAPWFAEAWNQRAIAFFHLDRFDDSANDCHQALELNAYHFGAAVGMGHCYLELGDAFAALDCFRRAVKLNPDLEGVRKQIEYLQRTLEGK